MLKTFLKYYKPYGRMMALLVLGSCLRAALELLFPYLVRQLLEEQLPKENLGLLLEWSGLLASLYLAAFGLHYLINYYSFVLSANMENDMRRDLFRHIQQMSFSFFDKNKSGQLLSRVTGDLAEIGDLACRAPNDVAVCGLSMLGTMVILICMNPTLGSLVALLLLFKTVHTFWINGKMKFTYFANRSAMGDMTAKAAESLSGVRLVKAFATEKSDLAEFMEKADAYVLSRKAAFRIRAYFMSSMIFFSNFINVAILVGGGLAINRGLMRFSDLVAFFLYVGMFMKPLMQLMMFTEMYQKGMAGFRRFYEVMQEQPAIVDRPDAVECASVKGEITFEHVSFGYGEGGEGRTVLHDFSLTVRPGETVAFVGATGAGKTTIASLLLRFYEVQGGRIAIDGVDIRDYSQQSLRRQIGLVQQDVFLFSDSVRHNIAYGSPGAGDAEVEQAAAAASADEFIRQLPKGYATEIGERGVKLSGGQKQRLAIARVFLKNPPILVLDEATSALDNKTEQQIQQELDKLAVGRTTLIIAHRLSTIRHADKIVVLHEGRAVESGTHEELLARRGRYYDLYQQE